MQIKNIGGGIQMPKLLITGGSGRMGKELQKQFREGVISGETFPLWEWTVATPSHDALNIQNPTQVKGYMQTYTPDIVLHLAGYTDVGLAEVEKKQCYNANVIGTRNIARYAKHLIYMSTEYIFDGERGNYQEEDIPNPVNFYSLTKLLGEHEAARARRFTILRTLFKPRPFEHNAVCTDMWTSGDYVDVIAKEIVTALSIADRLPRVLHMGTGRKNLFDLAKQTRDDILPIKRNSISVKLPRDTSLNTKVWEELKGKEL
jgi:dTDP-4-dehydrorhamnose reductase